MKLSKTSSYKIGELIRKFHLLNVETRYDDNHAQAENNFDEVGGKIDGSSNTSSVGSESQASPNSTTSPNRSISFFVLNCLVT